MTGQGFRVRRPLGADRDNDPDDIAMLDGALARLTGRRHADGARWRRLRGVQAARGLVADATILPGGPTEAAMDAGLHALAAGGHGLDPERNVPLAASVGRGGVNLPDDVATVRQALDLVRPGRTVAPEDPVAVGAELADFQRAHGLATDGLALPHGPTRARLGHLVAPRLARLLDPAAPGRGARVRAVPGIPTAFGVSFGTADPDAGARASARALQVAIDREAAFAARIAGGTGDDRLAGDDGDDDLSGAAATDIPADATMAGAGDADTAAEAVSTGAAVLERFAGDDDDLAEQQRVLDLVRRQSEGRPTAELENRLRGTLQALRQARDPHGPVPAGFGARNT